MAENSASPEIQRIGIISDTHGHFPASILRIFEDVDLIIHAGDVDTPEVLGKLRQIAPVVAVRGNMDRGPWADHLPRTDVVKLAETLLYVLHDPYQLDLVPEAAGFNAVISGHTHRPALEIRNGVVFLNPGSAVMPRFNTAPSVALLHIQGKSLDVQLVSLPE